MTKGECEALMAIAARVYDRPIDPELAEDWALGLDDVTEEEGLRALRWHIKNSKFFPTVADLRFGSVAAAPRQTYLPPHVPDPVPREEIRAVVEETLAKLKGGG